MSDRGLSFTATHCTSTYSSIDPTLLQLPPNFKVLITGSSRGIGRAISLSFAQAGASAIALLARNAEDLEILKREMLEVARERGRELEVRWFAVDVSEGGEVERVARELEGWGRLDVLVNNAGYLPPPASIESESPENHWQAFETNYKGTYNIIHYLLPLMKSSPHEQKTIINLTSWGVVKPVRPNSAAYYTSKTAVARLTELLAIEEKDFVVVSMHPGGVRTDMTRSSPEELQPWLVDSPYLCAGVCLWLSITKRPWLSGRYISCNWDVDELEAKREEIVEKDLLKPYYRFE